MKRQSSFRSFVFSFTESRKWKFDSWFGSPIRASTDWVVVSQLVSYAPLLTAIVKPSRKKFHSSIKHTHTHTDPNIHTWFSVFFFIHLTLFIAIGESEKMAIYESQNRVFMLLLYAWRGNWGLDSATRCNSLDFSTGCADYGCPGLQLNGHKKKEKKQVKRVRAPPVRKRLYRLLSASCSSVCLSWWPRLINKLRLWCFCSIKRSQKLVAQRPLGLNSYRGSTL